MEAIKNNKWTLDKSHTTIGFSVRHLMISHVKGHFNTVEANIYTTGLDFTTAQIDLFIDAASITTGDAERDMHLKSYDFLDVVNHKQITFTATEIGLAQAEDVHELWGDLTMKGITKAIKLEVTFNGNLFDPWGNQKAGFSICGKINRSDWGLIWNSAMDGGGVLVSDEIKIQCELELLLVDPKMLSMQVSDAKQVTAIN